MFTIAEQCSLAGKALYEAQLASFNAYAQAAYESGMALAERNVDAFRTTLAANTVAARQLLSTQAAEH
jgi:hypothetical protein